VNTIETAPLFCVCPVYILFRQTYTVYVYLRYTDVHSIAIGSHLFIIPTYAQFYNIITSPLYVFRHSECHPQWVTVLKAQTIHRLYKILHRYE
jgi:hypothetical protein